MTFPSYGYLEFEIKGTCRKYTGWYDGNPTNLQPCKQKDVDAEILTLIHNPSIIFTRCVEIME